MDDARPRAMGPDQRTIPPGPATPGMVREQAFVSDDRWVGVVRTEPGVRSGWHHHGETGPGAPVVNVEGPEPE